MRAPAARDLRNRIDNFASKKDGIGHRGQRILRSSCLRQIVGERLECSRFNAIRSFVRSTWSYSVSWSPRGCARALKEATKGVTAIVHLAARVHIMRDSAADPLAEFRRVNVEGTRKLLESGAASKIERFVFISSVKAVGESNSQPWTEDVVPQPVDPYGVSKLEAESLVLESGSQSGTMNTILRLPLVYGANVRGNMLRLFQLVDRRLPLPLGRVRNRRSIVFSGNVSSAIGTLLETEAARSQTFFLADPQTLSTPELIHAIGSAIGRRPVLLPISAEMLRAIANSTTFLSWIDPRLSIQDLVERLTGSLTISSEKLSRLTGFQPPYSVTEGLRQTALWYRSR